MLSLRDLSPPPVLSFDHRPTDEELQVSQPYRNPTGNVLLRKESDVWTIYQPRHFWIVTVFGLLMLGAISVAFVRHGYDLVLALMAVILAPFIFVGLAADRAIARQGSLVTYRRDRSELQIEGRAEPLPTADVTEIVELTVPDAARYEGWALYLVVLQRDGVYTAERLYHGQPSGRATWDVAPQLAKALGVGYRRIELAHPKPVLQPARFA